MQAAGQIASSCPEEVAMASAAVCSGGLERGWASRGRDRSTCAACQGADGQGWAVPVETGPCASPDARSRLPCCHGTLGATTLRTAHEPPNH